MGEQMGRTFAAELRRVMDRFLALLPKDAAKVAAATATVRESVRRMCPELLEETAGMAAGARTDEESLFRYRFYIDIQASFGHNCSSFFVLDGAASPWLGRTCDIEAEDHWTQTCHIRRPKTGAASACLTYLGMSSAVGMNGHGVAFVGGSAASRDSYGDSGVSCAMLMHKALHTCRSVPDVREMLLKQPVRGKGAVLLVADADGRSCLFESASGRRMNPIERPAERSWQACTNFYCSGEIANADYPEYLYNAYARYGVLSHQLSANLATRTVEGLQKLLADISQPGPHVPKGACPLETAYAALFDLKRRALYLAPGNPNSTAFEKVNL
jgi:predicted choloylglycine hydrolase